MTTRRALSVAVLVLLSAALSMLSSQQTAKAVRGNESITQDSGPPWTPGPNVGTRGGTTGSKLSGGSGG